MIREGTALSELPDDVETLKRLLIEKNHIIAEREEVISGKDTFIAELEKRNGLLGEQIALLRKYRFARSSERWTDEDRKQQRLFDEAESVAFEPRDDEEPETERITYTRKKGKKGRKPLPDSLPRTVIVHEFSEDERRCRNELCSRYGSCEKYRPVIGEETREDLEFIPAQIMVNFHVYRKYGEIKCEEFEADESQPGVIAAPREKRIIPAAIVTASLLAHTIVSKFADALPFYRQERIFARLGIHISRQNMCNWTIQASRACGAYLDLLRRKIREGPLINMDETSLQVLDEPNRSAASKSYMWVMVGTQHDGHRVVLYNYSPHRSAEVAESLLAGYEGSLQTDGYSGYNSVGAWKGIWHVGCIMHSRRKFFEADVGAKKKGHAKTGLKYIKNLYRIEHELRDQDLTDEEFVVARRKAAAPVFRDFKKWLEGVAKTVPPQSLLGQAVSYTLSEYKRLVRYLKYAYLTPDNNVAENGIRPYVVGRKNWLFANTPLGAHASATMYSLVETAKANNLDPFHFMHRLFQELPGADTEEALKKLLPWSMTGIPAYKIETGNN
jgi:transposase